MALRIVSEFNFKFLDLELCEVTSRRRGIGPVQASFKIPIPPSALATVIVVGIVVALILAVLLLPIYLLRIRVSGEEVAVSAPPMYSFSAKRGEVEEVFVADLSSRSDLKPSVRTWGTGLPGYCLGWFKLSNGAKAFCAISSDRAVVFKLRSGTYLIVTPSDVADFVSTLERLGWGCSLGLQEPFNAGGQ